MTLDQGFGGEIGHRQIRPAPSPVSLPLLRGELPRPGQCRVRRARHEPGPRLHAIDLRGGRRHLIHRLSSVRGSEQPGPPAFRCPVWIVRIMVSWGLVAMAMAVVSGPASFYAMRFLLGVAEAGFPRIILYLTYWFPAHERARIVSLFMAAVPLATLIGSPV